MILYIICAFSINYILCRRKRERERKSSPLTYKISINQSIKMSSGQWVVKFNPLGPQDPWHDVKKEYSILKGLHQALPVPKPVYASDSRDEGMVGTAFIVMEFVKVCLSEVHTRALLIITV